MSGERSRIKMSMHIKQSLERLVFGFESTKVTERRKVIEEFLELTNNSSNEVIKVLNELSKLKDSSLTWNKIYRIVHNAVLQEAEKQKKGTGAGSFRSPAVNKSMSSCCSLILKIARLAHEDKDNIFLSIKKTLFSVLQVLDTDLYRSHLSDTYLEILEKHVLSNRKHFNKIETKHWSDLMHIFERLLFSKEFNTNSGELLKPFFSIVQSCPVVVLYGLEETIEKLWNDYERTNTRFFNTYILKVTIEFCGRVACDRRQIICKLGENVIRIAKNMYSSKSEDFGGVKSLLFDFFLMQMLCHHPKGCPKGSPSSFAHSWKQWDTYVHNLFYDLIDTEIKCILKSSKMGYFPGESEMKMWDNFVKFATEVLRQVLLKEFESENKSNTDLHELEDKSPSRKKFCSEKRYTLLLNNLQSGSAWPWLQILSSLFKNYPETIPQSQYLITLETLTKLSSSFNDVKKRCYLISCLTNVLNMQTTITNTEIMSAASVSWNMIWEMIRTMWLHQNETDCYELIRMLVLHEKSLQIKSFFHNYMSRAMKITLPTIQTFAVMCRRHDLFETVDDRHASIQWIVKKSLDVEDIDLVLHSPIIAKLSSALIFKVVPDFERDSSNEIMAKDRLSRIEEVYFKSSFEKVLLYENYTEKQIQTFNSNKDKEIQDFLIELLQERSHNMKHSTDPIDESKKIIDELHLICNVFSELCNFNLLEENSKDFQIMKSILDCLIKGLSVIWADVIKILETSNKNRTILDNLTLLFNLKLNIKVSSVLRDTMSVGILPMLLKLYREKEDNSMNTEVYAGCSKSPCLSNQKSIQITISHLTKLLCSYAFSPNVFCMNACQKKTFLYIRLKYNQSIGCSITEEILIAKSIVRCRPGVFSCEELHLVKDILDFLLEHHRYELITDILQILHDYISHVSVYKNEDLCRSVMANLRTLYHDKNLFTQKVRIELIKCLHQLFVCDPEELWSKWDESSRPAWLILPSFLCDNFQEIRLFVIPILSVILVSTKCSRLSQKIFFDEICDKIIELFEIKKPFLCRDETDNRIVSALHGFMSIACSGSTYSRRSIFSIFQLHYQQKFHLDTTRNLIETLSVHLGNENVNSFINTNIAYLLGYWHQGKYPLSEFPYQLTNSTSEIDFYVKYVNITVPILLQNNDTKVLNNISCIINKPVDELIQTNFSSLYSIILPLFASEDKFPPAEVLKAKTIFSNLNNILSVSGVNSLILSTIDKILIDLLQMMFDTRNFIKEFSLNVTISELGPKVFSFDIIMKTLEYIEKTILKSESIIVTLVQKSPSKLEHVLRHFTFEIEKRLIIEEKLTAIHIFFTLVNTITRSFRSPVMNNMVPYLIRDICITFVHLIKKYRDNSNSQIISMVCCIALKKFCQQCILGYAAILEEFLVVIVGALIPSSKDDSELGKVALNFLKYLIIEEHDNLSKAISQLDPFPTDERFTEIRMLYNKSRRKFGTLDLENEIIHFLNIRQFSECPVESLEYLKEKLCTNKGELEKMYCKLESLQGTCEECDASSLHGLVYTLVKLCSSSDKNVSIEAAKCLGELGPADLMTLILRAKKVILAEVMKEVNTQIVVAGYVIYLLSNLLIDADFAIRSTASIAMYQVANSGPGKNFLSSKNNYVATDFGKGSVERKYIVPFIKTTPIESKIKKFIFHNKTFYEYLKQDALWWNGDVSPDGHVHWITTLTSALLQLFPSDSFLNSLISLSKSKANFAEKLIPILIELILHEANTELCMIISCGIKLFFTNVWFDVPVNLSSLDCMLDIVYFNKVRSNRNYIPDNKQSLELNYLFIAKAALIGSRYFACILYVELWCREQIEHYELEDDRLSILEKIYHVNPGDGKKIQNILREACEKVGDIDALQGCGVSYLLDMESRIDYYKRLGRWDQIICHYDLRLFNKNHINSSNESVSNELVRPSTSSLLDFKSNENIFYSTPKVNIAALKSAGLYNLAWNYSIGSENIIDSECCWRLSKWSYSNTESNEKIDFEKYRYFTLKSIHEVNAENTLSYLERARSCVVETLTCSNTESCKKFYDSLSRLWSLREVEDFYDFFVSKKKTLDVVLTRWKENDRFNVNDFIYIEPVWSQRISMLKMANKNSCDVVKQSLFDIQLKLAGMARKKGLTSVAKIFLSSILDMENLSATNKYKLKLEDAHLEWATSTDHMIGRHLLRNLLENRSETNMSLRSYALQLYGSWMLEKRWENAQPYFNESLEILNSLEELSDEDRHTRIDVYIQCAKLADTEYQKLADYMKSQELQCKKAFMKKSLEISKALRSKYEKTKNITVDDRKLLCTSEHSFEIEKSEIEKTEKELNDYLNNAMKYYLLAVSESSEHNLKLFRLVSLWLQNRNCEISEFYDLISKVPTYKFLILLPQIIPHLTNKNDKFSKTIKEIIRKCAVDHPHHTLPVLISLANTYKDRDYVSSQIDIPNDNRVVTAQSLLLDLKKTYLKNLIIEMENVSNALISLACLPSAKKSGKYSIPSNQPICRLINLEHAPIPTVNIEISPSGNYSNIIGIHRWEKTYNNVGGVNAPKKIICVGTDGISRSQLVKGQDDLRQDAVMQQVFTNLNTMLFASNNRHLKIRTYKIIPLSQRSGILEWCENTMNVADYLTGNQERPGAHESYRPKDLKPAVCREMMTGVRRKTVKEKLAVYNTICSKIKPVFHHFFWEHFGNAAIWWQRRRTYTLSVAASSAVGYILGLGDRHLSNLLIDKVTAEVVHIDFGIAFEQGKLLPTPETVPFRLTRDIEDAMGASGVEGTFRRSFERTMSVLRKNSDTILSILEVLLYDPLYMWTVSAAKAQEIQCDHTLSSDMIADGISDEHEINFTAKSVLKRLALKLQGREDNTDASIEGQVERLLQRARDPANLSCLFSGWQPYL